eukprot:CAMPEP_0203855664 /NCGR_PEP_ID=MMETSP0359-20131031/9760_1 /ASSEMBLY_ACC=CAM_ASM_000338 /TAXON_ID=268821 /ORGANISM="Scrippsiella Hangoei, Strain SHTV-5" /LENGTH=157 /DNA_ID=CAMNT_0050772221 /DNA_START=530 /DNA_END=1000 /DNA_ORIENTATION=+
MSPSSVGQQFPFKPSHCGWAAQLVLLQHSVVVAVVVGGGVAVVVGAGVVVVGSGVVVTSSAAPCAPRPGHWLPGPQLEPVPVQTDDGPQTVPVPKQKDCAPQWLPVPVQHDLSPHALPTPSQGCKPGGQCLAAASEALHNAARIGRPTLMACILKAL